ncbi:MAG TPA: hypothetical protein VIS48_13050 [Candidatus Kryptonia bacterium]
MRRDNFLVLIASCSLFIIFSNRSAYSQQVVVTNATFTITDSNVVVHYDLNGPTDKQYKVELVLRRQTQPFFRMLPTDISGDVGTGEFAGKNREIVWHFFNDVPYGFDGNDFYFEVDATLLGAKKGGTNWLYYVGGVIGAAAAVYFGRDLFTKGSSTSELPSPPAPPIR